ncbi:MAG TPA: hypothetical protein VG650_08435 [Mycobacteriales bacterium]|nr:hypothetical protein [Mycobacteriales bacterium]
MTRPLVASALAASVLSVAVAGCSGTSAGGSTQTPAHRPLLSVPGAPAPAADAALLLRPADLGPAWRYRTSPAIETKPETTSAPGQPSTGEISRVQAILWASHWNGTMWQDDADVIEYGVQFATRADGRRFVRGDSHPVQVSGHRVWILTKHGRGGPDSALIDVGTRVVQLIIGHAEAAPPSTPSTAAIVQAAVRRAYGQT